MPKEIGQIKEKKVEIVNEIDIPEHFFPDLGAYKKAKMFQIRVEGILRPIFIILPAERATESEVLKEVEKETAGEI
ncbi:MAG: hypothetical protein ABIM54_00870 [candidate division WOR-3 bacterium]